MQRAIVGQRVAYTGPRGEGVEFGAVGFVADVVSRNAFVSFEGYTTMMNLDWLDAAENPAPADMSWTGPAGDAWCEAGNTKD